MIWFFVLVRVLANPLSNVFQKVLTRRAAGPLFIICVTHALLTPACLPLLLVRTPPLQPGFWVNISVSAALAVAGNALLVGAVRRTDLSVLGPINAYKSVVSLVPGVVLLREIPGPAGLGGIALIVAGSYFLVDKETGGAPHDAAGGTARANPFVRFFRDRGVQYRFAALVLSATEAVFLKRAMLASSPAATFAWWAVLGFAVSLAAVALMRGKATRDREIGVWRANRRPYLLLALTTGLMQYCTLVTFRALPVGYALALFQTSTLLTVILGHQVFREPQFLNRMAGSLVMVAGAALIIGSTR